MANVIEEEIVYIIHKISRIYGRTTVGFGTPTQSVESTSKTFAVHCKYNRRLFGALEGSVVMSIGFVAGSNYPRGLFLCL